METGQHLTPGDAALEPLAGLDRGGLAGDEEAALGAAVEQDAVDRATGSALEGPFENGPEEAEVVLGEGGAIDHEEERTPPALQGQGAKAHQRHLAAEVVDDGLGGRGAEGIGASEACGDAGAEGLAEGLGEGGGSLRAGGLDQGEERAGRDQDASRVIIEANEAPGEIERDGFGRVEGGGRHGLPGGGWGRCWRLYGCGCGKVKRVTSLRQSNRTRTSLSRLLSTSEPMRPLPTFALLLSILSLSGALRAQGTPGSAPVSGAAPPSVGAPPWDPWPHGRLFGEGPPRPPDGALRLCSFREPVCVHGAAQDGALALSVLEEAEGACRFLRHQARLPRPTPDSGGGSGAVDLYLQPSPGAAWRVGFEVPLRSPRDQAPVYALLDRALSGCARSTAVHRALAVAHLASLDGGEAGASFASSAAYLAWLGTNCGGEVLAALDDSQARPSRPLMPPGPPDDPRGSPLLWWWLDATLGNDAPGTLLTGLWHNGQQSTPLDYPRFRNEPDLLGVLRKLALARKTTVDALLLELAVARAFLGERDDGQHFAEASWIGAAGRMRVEQSWPFASLPRRLAFTPLDPTGMVYTWVDLQRAPPHPRLGFHASWEHPVTMRWALVRVSPQGEELSRMVLPHRQGVYEADAIVEELDGAAGVLVVGVNNGETGPHQPVRLDESPYEPHGGTLHVFVP